MKLFEVVLLTSLVNVDWTFFLDELIALSPRLFKLEIVYSLWVEYILVWPGYTDLLLALNALVCSWLLKLLILLLLAKFPEILPVFIVVVVVVVITLFPKVFVLVLSFIEISFFSMPKENPLTLLPCSSVLCQVRVEFLFIWVFFDLLKTPWPKIVPELFSFLSADKLALWNGDFSSFLMSLLGETLVFPFFL